jgi:ornithine carbamoyltransferase
VKHLLSLKELSSEEIHSIIENGLKIKAQPQNYFSSCDNKGLLLLFQKTSTRTNLSFQSAINQLGGYAVSLDWDKSNFSISPIKYEVRYASRNCDLIIARLKKHSDLLELAQYSYVPVINGCCEKYHPSQALADLMTIYEKMGTFDGVTLTYVGIHNNVANSLIAGCMKVGLKLILVTPIVNEQSWDQELMDEAQKSGFILKFDNLTDAASQSDFIYTDTWIDMEFFNNPSYQEERDYRIKIMSKYQINRENLAKSNPFIMHDMPIHPGFEIEEELIESEKSIIYTQGENRMHVEKSLVQYLLSEH